MVKSERYKRKSMKTTKKVLSLSVLRKEADRRSQQTTKLLLPPSGQARIELQGVYRLRKRYFPVFRAGETYKDTD